jgi:hypothetical protein|tara:strand:- start:9237 stop:9914 length:678 start_codon:yes stop_codon:yes gene_type:complete
MTKIKSICIDTLTAIQERQYAADKKKPGHDQWFDYGVTIANFVNELSNLGFEIVLVLGEPGTGKSSGMRTLDPGTNIWYNADKKNPTWIGGREEYGKKFKPTPRLHQLPDTYADIINHIKAGIEADMFDDEKVAFVSGHTETYKSGLETRVRLKTLGKLANKMQIEGNLEHVLYSVVKKNDSTGDAEFLLETQNNGTNTARSSQGMLEGVIHNDYKLILEAIRNY